MGKSKFQTIVNIPDFEYKTGYFNKNMFIGSCFTKNIGLKMKTLKYDVNVNPFGILYNPISIANGLKILIENKKFDEHQLFMHNGLWHSFFHHGQYSGADKYSVLEKINFAIEEAHNYLLLSDFLFITFGTAWVYENNTSKEIVANCHKLPDNNFVRYRLTVNDIAKTYEKLISELRKINPNLKIVFTVSPVRHWKDGAIENQRSKSTLILAIDDIIKNSSTENIFYFPAYEIVMDELRDYRFYDDDMIHISPFATQHIWERFCSSLIDVKNRTIEKQILKIIKAATHKPFNKYTREHLSFLKKMNILAENFMNKYPTIDLTLESDFFKAEISEIGNFITKNS